MARSFADFLRLVQEVRALQVRYRKTLDSTLRFRVPEKERELDDLAAALAVDLLAVAPACPKCGAPMTGGAPHGDWSIQSPDLTGAEKGGAA